MCIYLLAELRNSQTGFSSVISLVLVIKCYHLIRCVFAMSVVAALVAPTSSIFHDLTSKRARQT